MDCGALFDHKKDKAEFMLKAMERMGYDALNLGVPELQFGKEFLERSRSLVSFPYIASNLFYCGEKLPWTRESIIKKIGNIKVAILGILDPDDLTKFFTQEQQKGLQAVSPKAALERLIPGVRQKADLVILLSQLGTTKHYAMLEAVRGIDVSIFSGCAKALNEKPPENTVILHAGSKGMTMGLLKVTLDDNGVLNMSERSFVPMGLSVPGNKEIAGLVERFKQEQKMKKEKMKKEKMKVLQLTPEEFMERYRKEKTERIKGEGL